MEKIAYFHGRFQPFHNGHLEIVKTALTICNTLVIGISNPFRCPPVTDDKFDSKGFESILNARDHTNNPWPYWARLLMIKKGLELEGINLNSIIFIPNLNNTGLPVNEIRFPKEFTKVFICPKQDHNKTIMNLYLREGWDVYKIDYHDKKFGSSLIRERMRKGKEWEIFVPNGTIQIIKELSNLNIIKI